MGTDAKKIMVNSPENKHHDPKCTSSYPTFSKYKKKLKLIFKLWIVCFFNLHHLQRNKVYMNFCLLKNK